ncbi:hypothetical protein ABIC76_005048, partial [Ralstonia sp. 1138]
MGLNDETLDNVDLSAYTADIEVYKRFREPSNPYGIYNNQDRVLNAVYRAWTTGELGNLIEKNGLSGIKNSINWNYESTTNFLSQYLWASTAILGVGYSFNRSDLWNQNSIPGDRAAGNQDAYNLAAITAARSVINATLETGLFVANGIRWNASKMNSAIAVNSNTLGIRFFQSLVQEPYQTAVKSGRSKFGAAASFGFTANALIGLGAAGKQLSLALHNPAASRDEYGNNLDLVSSSMGLIANSANVIANALKGASTVASVRGAANTSKNLGIAGSFFGALNGAASIAALAPLLANDKLTPEQKGVIAAEMGVQIVGGSVQGICNTLLAINAAKGAASTSAGVLGPALGAAAAGIVLAMSPLEIYGLVQQSKYANQLDQLAKELGPLGYDGDSLLASFYRDKTAIDGTIVGATTLLAVTGATVSAAIAATGIGAPVAVIVGLVTSALSGILKGIQQPLIERLARDYAEKINEQGGSFAYFAKNLNAKYSQILSSAGAIDTLKKLQSDFGVDSVIGITSVGMSSTAMELAAVTYNAANLKTRDAYIDRFVSGTKQADRTLSLDVASGSINLGTGQVGSKQLLTFLTPLMAPGNEVRQRVSTGKNSYYTSLDVIMKSPNWSISDGASSSTMDLRKIVSRLKNSNGTIDGDIGLIVNGGDGDDTVLANASKITFDGGSGHNGISYAGLGGDVQLNIIATDTGFSVQKSLQNVEIYRETTSTQKYSAGKRTETVDYRSVELQTMSGPLTAADTLTNVQEIYGGNGNDSLDARKAKNSVTLSGGGGNDTLWGSDADDVLMGNAGNDNVHGGGGNDLVVQDASPGADLLDGGDGNDIVNYGAGAQNWRKGISADLAAGTVQKFANTGTTAAVGVTARYVRVYHNSVTTPWIGLSGIRVVSGGVDVSAGRSVRMGANIDIISPGPRTTNVLTDDSVGASGTAALFETARYPRVTTPYFELDLGAQYSIDTIDLWATSNGLSVSNDLKVCFSDTPFTSDYQPDAAAMSKKVVDVGVVSAASGDAVTDSLTRVEGIIGTSLADTLLGNDEDNTLSGGAGNDVISGRGGNDRLAGGAGADVIRGDAGDDVILQDIGRDRDVIDGGEGVDTVDYSSTSLSGIGYGIQADLSINQVVKTLADNTAYVGTAGRYIRIYHTDASQVLSLTGMKVYVGGVDVAAGKISRSGVDSGSLGGAQWNNVNALTDSNIGGGWNGASTSTTSNLAYAGGAGAYIELDLGSVQNIDAISLWGRADVLNESSNLRVFVSNTAFGGGDTYASLTADTTAKRAEFGAASTTVAPSSHTFIDQISNVENVNGTSMDDTLIGDTNSNALSGGDGNDMINGGDGDDVLSGGLGADIVNAGGGDDLILQDIERFNNRLDGGQGNDTVDYSLTAASWSAGINADLGQGKVTKAVGGTTGALRSTGRYLRIYHTDATAVVSLTGMKVYVAGTDVAA